MEEYTVEESAAKERDERMREKGIKKDEEEIITGRSVRERDGREGLGGAGGGGGRGGKKERRRRRLGEKQDRQGRKMIGR